MFGYVVPDHAELRVRDHELYRAVYCSLCHELQRFGLFSKLFLNYDFVFAAMLGSSCSGSAIETLSGRCSTNPFRKERLIRPFDALHYSAAALIITSHHKLSDDIADERLPKKLAAYIALLLTSGSYKKARCEFPSLDTALRECMNDQLEIESKSCQSLDEYCDPTARGLSAIFEGLSDDREKSAILGRLGYLLGRFVYLADACDDLRDDLRLSRFNPFAVRFGLTPQSGSEAVLAAISEAHAQLRLTTGSLEACYRLLSLSSFSEILDNIIYLGLARTIRRVGRDKKKGNEK